ncbi:MAG: histidine kinase [Arcobacter sp.]|uniref:sensor histidine kinase n=1 Tax=uncultured Arcobacter sp. TaxID=165434 RepID=UPI000CB1D7BF|nr:cache domain-containing protein [uncultured Arcobacter sp.]PLY09361.1 MAG: histidine kinase [Arcobacter sp.]
MIKAKSLYHLILYSITFIVILISFFTFIIIENAFDDFQEKIEIIKSDYANKQKDSIRNEIEKTINLIHFYNTKYKNIKSTKQIQKEILEIIESTRDKKSMDNYLFIYDFSGTSIYNPISTHHVGKNLFSYKDKTGKQVIKELINISKDNSGGYVEYLWLKPKDKEEVKKISFALSYKPWKWTIGTGAYLNEINKVVTQKELEYDEKISNYILQILSLTIMLVLYSIFIYKNATILIVNDVKAIGKYFKDSQEDDTPINQNKIIFGEFKVIANYAHDAMHNIKDKNNMLSDLNAHLETTVARQTKELTQLIEKQKKFLKNSVHEINTPLSIIQINLDLYKMSNSTNKYIRNIESGAKTIQYIFDDLSFMIKKDRVSYEKEVFNFSEYLKDRLEFFDDIATANSLFFVTNIQDPIFLNFNKTLLQRILDNNISNAIKYSFKDSPIYVKLLKDDLGIIFEVKTNSKKIEQKDRIFNDFYRENDARGGFGLGLRIVKEICDKNNVIINLDSTDENTKFTYRFTKDENTAS